jgi:hypothetical protein
VCGSRLEAIHSRSGECACFPVIYSEKTGLRVEMRFAA